MPGDDGGLRGPAAQGPAEPDGQLRAEVARFQERVGFLGVLGVAFTGGVFLMNLLRPVLEPFMWALFLVIALQPLATLFEEILLRLGQLLCFCRCPGAGGQPRKNSSCPLRAGAGEAPEQDAQAASKAASTVGEDVDRWPSAGSDFASSRGKCCDCWSRVVSVTLALITVLGVVLLVAMFIFQGALRLKEDFAVYELGAKNAVEKSKEFSTLIFGSMPRHVVDSISDNALASVKAILSELIGTLLSHVGKIFVELLMLGLYVMFWLCTPMPLNTKTERIFRRYLFLKGFACVCYGCCVGLMLRSLEVELAAVFGLLSFFFSFIPEVGAFIAMILPVPVILFDSRLEAPFLTLIIATAGQLGLKFVFANIIEVKLVENDATMKMHPVITLLAVTFFGFIWGPTGMLLSVPIMAYIKVVVLSDGVPAAYRDPVLVLLEGDRRAPERHRRRRALSLTAKELLPASNSLRRKT